MPSSPREPLLLSAIALAALAVSAIHPHDRLTWVLEILLRRTPLVRGGWLFFLVASVCLAVSACYEFIEWWSAVLLGEGADAFLGSQGDPWSTQWDMFTALVGAIIAQLTMTRLHDRQLARLGELNGTSCSEIWMAG